MKKTRRIAMIMGLLAFIGWLAIMLWAQMTPTPDNLGVSSGRLAPCPDRPNCVCSQDTDAEHGIDPFPVMASGEESIERIASIVRRQPRMRIVEQTSNYMRIECTSLLMRYVDDLEFYVPDSKDVVHVRSASRVGYSDLGANRKRVERLRQLYREEAS